MLTFAKMFILLFLFTPSAFAESAISSRDIECMKFDVGIEQGCAILPDKKDQCNEPDQEAFYKESCLYDKVNDLVPEIVDAQEVSWKELKEKGLYEASDSKLKHRHLLLPKIDTFNLIPTSIWRDYSEDQIVRSLIYRVYKRYDKPKIIDLLRTHNHSDLISFYDDLKIQLSFKREVAFKIAMNGFLNQHQIGNSNGFYVPGTRITIEQAYLGLRLTTIYDELTDNYVFNVLPKYAYASPLNPNGGLSQEHSFDSLYGSVFAEMNESVMHRSTFTPNDSLLSVQKNLESGYIHTARMLKVRSSPFVVTESNYGEAQIWGTLDKSDVEDLLVNCLKGRDWSNESTGDNLEMVDALTAKDYGEAFGVPVYNCKTSVSENGTFVKQTQLKSKSISWHLGIQRIEPDYLMYQPKKL